MAVYEISKLQVRRGLENTTGVPILDSGEFGWASDTESLYIGLRRIDGGSRDANVRVLTENDLRNFFNNSGSAAGGALNVAGTYTFRAETFIATSRTNITYTDPDDKVKRTVQKKLDDFVNLNDFRVTADGDDISASMQTAIDHLYLFERKDDTQVIGSYNTYTEKILYIPAGNYQITQYIYIPGRTRIVGEGKENTKITQLSSASGFFQTVGNNSTPNARYTFANANPNFQITSPQRPDYISIENLTLIAASTATSVATPFIRLDACSHSRIKDVRMVGQWNVGLINSNVTATNTGIELRGYNSPVFKTENILIENCQFENLHSAVFSRYDVEHITINNNKFLNLYKGINFNEVSNSQDGFSDKGPNLINIINNRFDKIYNEAVFVGTSTSALKLSNIITRNNQFLDVGNNGLGYNTNTGTAIIRFWTKGNVSNNDYFKRHEEKLNNIDTNTATYFPLVWGEVNLSNEIIYTRNVSVGTTSTVAIFPITDYPQLIDVKFQEKSLGNPSPDRQGSLTIYVKDGANPFYYQKEDYHYITYGLNWEPVSNSAKKFLALKTYNPPPSGTGAQFSVKVRPFPFFTGFISAGTYTDLTILAGGSNYILGDLVTLNGIYAGGTVIANDIKILVTNVNISGAITAASFQTPIFAANTINTATYNITTSSIARQGGDGSTYTFIHSFNIQNRSVT